MTEQMGRWSRERGSGGVQDHGARRMAASPAARIRPHPRLPGLVSMVPDPYGPVGGRVDRDGARPADPTVQSGWVAVPVAGRRVRGRIGHDTTRVPRQQGGSRMTDRSWWTSIDPKVVETVCEAEATWTMFAAGMKAFESEYGVQVRLAVNPFTGDVEAVGVQGDVSRLPGRWTNPDPRRRRRPYKTNTEGRRLLAALVWKRPRIPGLPAGMSVKAGANRFTVWTDTFTLGNVAWAVTGPGVPVDDPVDETLWRPAVEREYVAARHAHDKEDGPVEPARDA
ncbi:hypothetical protein [Bifidobacterium felsineum]|uniref:hypothetical protein n=1 Tax=Bifidobacterium felsineum TaxID=2045440 RepID=UPI001BDDAFC6|nr:hypothetical protein [Bifidobacterium felsineum]MBT1164612.1 hypothetical protein [Bifidobacterium felsineum]